MATFKPPQYYSPPGSFSLLTAATSCDNYGYDKDAEGDKMDNKFVSCSEKNTTVRKDECTPSMKDHNDHCNLIGTSTAAMFSQWIIFQSDVLLVEILLYAGPSGMSKLRSFPSMRTRISQICQYDWKRIQHTYNKDHFCTTNATFEEQQEHHFSRCQDYISSATTIPLVEDHYYFIFSEMSNNITSIESKSSLLNSLLRPYFLQLRKQSKNQQHNFSKSKKKLELGTTSPRALLQSRSFSEYEFNDLGILTIALSPLSSVCALRNVISYLQYKSNTRYSTTSSSMQKAIAVGVARNPNSSQEVLDQLYFEYIYVKLHKNINDKNTNQHQYSLAISVLEAMLQSQKNISERLQEHLVLLSFSSISTRDTNNDHIHSDNPGNNDNHLLLFDVGHECMIQYNMASNHSTSSSILSKMISLAWEVIDLKLQQHQQCEEKKEFKWIIDSIHFCAILEEVAKNPNTLYDDIYYLLCLSNKMLTIASSSSMLFMNFASSLRMALVSNPRTSMALLEKLLIIFENNFHNKDLIDFRTIAEMAKNCNCNDAILDRILWLSYSKDDSSNNTNEGWPIRENIAKHSETSVITLQRLSVDPDEHFSVRSLALQSYYHQMSKISNSKRSDEEWDNYNPAETLLLNNKHNEKDLFMYYRLLISISTTPALLDALAHWGDDDNDSNASIRIGNNCFINRDNYNNSSYATRQLQLMMHGHIALNVNTSTETLSFIATQLSSYQKYESKDILLGLVSHSNIPMCILESIALNGTITVLYPSTSSTNNDQSSRSRVAFTVSPSVRFRALRNSKLSDRVLFKFTQSILASHFQSGGSIDNGVTMLCNIIGNPSVTIDCLEVIMKTITLGILDDYLHDRDKKNVLELIIIQHYSNTMLSSIHFSTLFQSEFQEIQCLIASHKKCPIDLLKQILQKCYNDNDNDNQTYSMDYAKMVARSPFIQKNIDALSESISPNSYIIGNNMNRSTVRYNPTFNI